MVLVTHTTSWLLLKANGVLQLVFLYVSMRAGYISVSQGSCWGREQFRREKRLCVKICWDHGGGNICVKGVESFEMWE